MKKVCSLTAAALIAATLPAESICAVSSLKQGYGQGTQTDEHNRPLGAAEFNRQYSRYDALAMTNDDKRIILTFDQGYENGFTEPILDVLRRKNVKAVFFLTGDYAKKEEGLVRRMIKEGHILGNHGMTHASLPELSDSELEQEVMSLHKFILDKYSYEMQYLRPPCGEYSERSLSLCRELGYKTMMWSFAYVDWQTDRQPDKSTALEKMLSSAHGGGIYLLHSVSSTNAAVLADAIDGLRERGFIL